MKLAAVLLFSAFMAAGASAAALDVAPPRSPTALLTLPQRTGRRLDVGQEYTEPRRGARVHGASTWVKREWSLDVALE